MSLLRLLTAGKSLVGLQDYRSRYMSRGGPLPKFRPKKNPFRATARPEAGLLVDPKVSSTEVSSGSAASAPALLDAAGDREAPLNTSQETAGVSVKTESLRSDSTDGIRTLRGIPSLGESKAVGRNPGIFPWDKLAFWRGRKAGAPALPKFTKPMVQAELSLDEVRVVRNDLSDSDLEIVTAKPPVVKPAASVVENVPKAPPAEKAWGRVAGRIFGAGKV